MELLRLSRAARRLGVHPVTLRLSADNGEIPVTWVGRVTATGTVAQVFRDRASGLEKMSRRPLTGR
jgi:hypothetical protein